ncbi:hypothetical protein AVEN_130817-1, partial [Araneus ventricosus]
MAHQICCSGKFPTQVSKWLPCSSRHVSGSTAANRLEYQNCESPSKNYIKR